MSRPDYQWTDEARVRVQSAGLTVELVDAVLAAPSGLRRDTDTGALRVVTGMTDDARVIAVLSIRQAGTNRSSSSVHERSTTRKKRIGGEMSLTRDQLAALPAEEAAVYLLDNPGSLSEVLQTDPDRTADPHRWAVPALPTNVETTQISLRIPTALLAHFDHIAATGPSRSDLIRAAMIEFLAHRTAVPVTDAAVEAALSIVESVIRGRVAVTHVDVADAA